MYAWVTKLAHILVFMFYSYKYKFKMCSCNLTVCLKRWWGQQFDGSGYFDIFTWFHVNYHPDLKVPCVNVTADNFVTKKKKREREMTKFFSPFSPFCSIQSTAWTTLLAGALVQCPELQCSNHRSHSAWHKFLYKLNMTLKLTLKIT